MYELKIGSLHFYEIFRTVWRKFISWTFLNTGTARDLAECLNCMQNLPAIRRVLQVPDSDRMITIG